MARKKTIQLSDERTQKRLLAESDLEAFINLVHPKRLLGNIHREVIRWWTRPDAKRNQMLLLPRDHMKSALAAYLAVWRLTKYPALKILYISSTSPLAVKQLKFMKDILTCDAYRTFWPEMVEKEEAKREKWTEREISVDHPLRKEESIRDPSIFTAGLTSNIVGLHCDDIFLDDVVVMNNAYTEEGRDKVRNQYSLLASVEGTDSRKVVVGTRYHPLDLYNDLITLEIEQYDDIGNTVARDPLFEVKEHAVESSGDGTGEFIWPRQQRFDGKWFGFDSKILAEKRNNYINKTQFRAQYYNDPHDVDSSPIQRSLFQYYDPTYLHRKDGKWFFKNERLNVAAAVDFAYSLGKKADSTAIVVVGVDGRNNYYILEIDRFKVQKPSEYFEHIFKLYEKWNFRKIRAEVNAAQIVIVKDLKESYIKPRGLTLSIDEYKPTKWTGSKDERIMAALEPKYANGQIFHYPSGNCQILEEELLFVNPPHDDVKDALASCIDFLQGYAPLNLFQHSKPTEQKYEYHARFGGVI